MYFEKRSRRGEVRSLVSGIGGRGKGDEKSGNTAGGNLRGPLEPIKKKKKNIRPGKK